MQNTGSKTVVDDLPESIIIEEILVRLSAEDVLRCRIVCKSWHHETSTDKFLLAHHNHQPSLPVMDHIKRDGNIFDRRLFAFCEASPDGANHELYRQTILWYPRPDPYKDNLVIHASCDGLLIISFHHEEGIFAVCNPITRQRAPLPLLCEHDTWITRTRVVGFYKHRPSRAYHVLYSISTMNANLFTTVDFYIIAVGANERRPIEQPPLRQEMMDGLTCSYNTSVLYCGNLHWVLGRHYSTYGSNNILVFDTTSETFWWMCRPLGQYHWMSLLELDEVLSMCSSHDGIILDIYVMQDYKAEVWTLMYHIDLMTLKASPPLSLRKRTLRKIATLNGHEMLIEFPGCFLHCDISGKFLGKMECDEDEENRIPITPFRFQQNICQLPFFRMQENYGAWRMLEEEGDDDKYYSIWP